MNGELTVKIGNADRKVLLQEGYFDFHVIKSPLHQHSYAELHVVESGIVRYGMQGETIAVPAGTVLAIPPDVFHHCLSFEENTRHIAFQIEAPVEKLTTQVFPREVLTAFFKEIEAALQSGNYAGVAAYISLLCARFYPGEAVPCRRLQDDAFIIREFFSSQYNRDVTLSDLAKELCRSEKQAERLVLKYTGHTFKKELAAHRMHIAKHMLAAGEMTLTEAAEYVGYRTYSGFWKAYKKENN